MLNVPVSMGRVKALATAGNLAAPFGLVFRFEVWKVMPTGDDEST
jgi:hypothetical protein